MGVSITCSKSEFCNLGRGRGYQYWAFSLGAARIGHCWSSTQPVCLGQGEIMKLVPNWLKQLAEPPAAPGIQSSTQVSCCQWPEQPGWAEVTRVLPGQAQHKAKLQSTAQCQAALGAAPALGQGSSSWHRASTKGSGGSVAAGTAIQTCWPEECTSCTLRWLFPWGQQCLQSHKGKRDEAVFWILSLLFKWPVKAECVSDR